MRFVEKTFTYEGISINYYEGGAGPLLVFIPGWGTRPYTYRNALQLLAKKYHVITPELPGFNSFSAPKNSWHFSHYAEFFSHFIDFLSDKKVMVLGHSLGGGIALYTAAKSKKVDKLLLIDPFGISTEYSRRKLFLTYLVQLAEESIKPHNWRQALNNHYYFLLNLKNINYILPFTLKFFDRKIDNNTAIINTVTIPTIIMWGSRDKIFGKHTASNLQQFLPHAKNLTVIGTHNWIIFHPELITPTL